MKVLVIGLNGLGLMPTTCRKARILVKEKKAVVVRKTPYTIQLKYKTGVAGKAEIGIDTGSQHIGVGIISEDRVVSKAEHSMRSTMEKRALNETRKTYRRGRRYRKVRYRHPKFKARTKRFYSEKPVRRNGHMTHWVKKTNSFDSNRRKGWLPSSIQSKIDHHIRIIGNYMEALPVGTKLRIELARFDIARMKDSSVHGEMYQKGRMYDHENATAYVFHRDGYKCRVCHSKAGSRRTDGSVVKIRAHHIDYRSKGATDNPDRMATVCDRCHCESSHKEGGILYKWMVDGKKFARGYRDMTFMNILRKRMLKAFPEAEKTYGNITSADRKEMGLEKTHANDAVAIAAGGRDVIDSEETVYYQQVHKKKRSLHEAKPRKGRKKPNKDAVRNSKNTKKVTITRDKKEVTFYIYDRVSYNGKAGWISGFTGTSAYVKDENNEYIKYENATYNQIKLKDLEVISHNNNWLVGARQQIGK